MPAKAVQFILWNYFIVEEGGGLRLFLAGGNTLRTRGLFRHSTVGGGGVALI